MIDKVGWYTLILGSTQRVQFVVGRHSVVATGVLRLQWHHLGHMQICTSSATDNTSTSLLSFLQVGCPSSQQRQSTEGRLSWKTAIKVDMIIGWLVG